MTSTSINTNTNTDTNILKDLIYIRKVEKNDQNEIERLYRKAFQYYQIHGIPEIAACTSWFIEDKLKEGNDMNQIYEYYINQQNIDSKRCFWVVIDNNNNQNKIIGCIGTISSTEHQLNNYIELVRMAIDPNYHRYGIGNMLLLTLIDWGKQHQCDHIELSTLNGMIPACKFYEKNGFQLYKQKEIFPEEMFHRKFEGNQVFVNYYEKEI
jgi:ribosomal protein S18 acetylase RimI-like enzyme